MDGPETDDPQALLRQKLLLRRWKEVCFLYETAQLPQFRAFDVEDAVAVDEHALPERTFVALMMGHYRFRPSDMEKPLRRLYWSFPGAAADAVDVRELVCCYRVFQLRHRLPSRHGVAGLVALFVELLSDEVLVVARARVMRALCVGCVTTAERDDVWRLGEAALARVAAALELPPYCRTLPKTSVEIALRNDDALMDTLQAIFWRRLRPWMRTEVLTAIGDRQAQQFEEDELQRRLLKVLKQLQTRRSRGIFARWRLFASLEKRVRLASAARMRRHVRVAVAQWLGVLHTRRLLRRVRAAGRRAVLRRTLARVRLHAAQHKEARLMLLRKMRAERFDRIERGGRVVSRLFLEHAKRTALPVWKAQARAARLRELAVNLFRARSQAATWRQWLHFVALCQQQRREDAEARERQQLLTRMLNSVEDDERIAELEAAERARQARAADKAGMLEEKRLARQMDKARARAEVRARDRAVLETQHTERRARARAEARRRVALFDERWRQIKRQEVANTNLQTMQWFRSRNGKRILETTFKELKHDFFLPPDLRDKRSKAREDMLAHPATLAFGMIEAKTFHAGVELEAYFAQCDTSGDGELDFHELERALRDLELTLTEEQVRTVFRSVDTDESGLVSAAEFADAMERSGGGVPGCEWKLYTDPIEGMLTYHNFVTGEKVFDMHMSDAKLKEINIANQRAMRLMETVKRVRRNRKEAWEALERSHAATTLQRFYRGLRALRHVRHEIRMARSRAKAAAKADTNRRVAVLQALWRRRQTRRRFKQMVRDQVDRRLDEASGAECYFYAVPGEFLWAPPPLVDPEDVPPVMPWVVERSGYYRNVLTQETTWAQPSGYSLCDTCSVAPASRECRDCGSDYCFDCYVAEHDRTARHAWGHIEPQQCTECRAALGDRECEFCRSVLCMPCFEALHATAATANHEWSAL